MDPSPKPTAGRTVSEQLEDLVRKYAGLVQSVVRRVGGATAAKVGDDIEQQVFLEIWKQISGEQKIDYPSSYIYRASVRETVRVLKKERRHQRWGVNSRTSEATEPDPAKNPEKLLQGRETGSRIDEVLETLTAERRRAVRGHLAGFGVQEIMRLENWSYNRARNLVARGMADLRRGLRKRGIHA